MKILELLNRKGLELTEGKILNLSTFKFGGSEVHVICIADSQKLIDKFNTDVISPNISGEFGDKISFSPTTKESYEGDPVAKFELDDFACSGNLGKCDIKGCDKPSTRFGFCDKHFKSKLL